MCYLFEGKWFESDKVELLNEPKQTKEVKQINGKLQGTNLTVETIQMHIVALDMIFATPKSNSSALLKW